MPPEVLPIDRNGFPDHRLDICLNNISYLICEEPDRRSDKNKHRKSIPFDFPYYLIILLRKFGFRDKSSANILSFLLLKNLKFKNIIILSQSLIDFFRGLDKEAKIFDLQHGIIYSGKGSYISDGKASSNISDNNVQLLLFGNGFKEILHNSDLSNYDITDKNNIFDFSNIYSKFSIVDKSFIIQYDISDSQNNYNSFQRITHLQDSFLAPLKKVWVKGISAVASDKNKVNGILYLPDSNSKKLPLILFIHGGPVAQDEYSFDITRQIYAAAGYAVAAVNYRGSSGRGANYTKSIYADWGNKEVKDIIGITNELIKQGIADSTKLAIAGWSYGGILTNYTIATDTRFKAAVSGAGSSLMLSFYGTDQYITQYEPELGKPWNNLKKWLDVSYPFFKVKEIKTPTLFMASQADFNVPVVGAEQMYQAFKSEGIPTQLIIYPNQNHGIRVPSYLVHRYNSHLSWFKTYLK